jgi:hypothetical protein
LVALFLAAARFFGDFLAVAFEALAFGDFFAVLFLTAARFFGDFFAVRFAAFFFAMLIGSFPK